MLSGLFSILLITLIFGSIVSCFTFVFDVRKWHTMERKYNIVPSASEPEQGFTESEVIKYAEYDGQRDSSAVSFSWSESGLHTDNKE